MKNDNSIIYLGLIVVIGIVAYFMISQANAAAEAARQQAAQAAAMAASKPAESNWLNTVLGFVPSVLSFL